MGGAVGRLSPVGSPAAGATSLEALGDLVRPLSARSIVASVLLGTHPPRLSGRHLIALSARFGVTEGTTRVALSRMADRGELTNDDGTYELAGPLLARQRRQELQRRPAPAEPWDGRWEQAVVIATGRSATDRNRLRRALTAAGLGELREGVWLRPANLAKRASATMAPGMDGHLLWGLVELADHREAAALAAQLFDLDRWAGTTRLLLAALDHHRPQDDLATGFRLAAAVLQHLVHDPVLPAELAPPDWPGAGLRLRYDDYEAEVQDELRALFRALI